MARDVLPDVELGPVGERERAQVLTLADARVQQRPRLGPLRPRIPATLSIAEAEDAFLRSRLVLIASAATERGIEAVFGQCIEQGDRLQPVAAGAWPCILHRAAGVDGSLHAGHHQSHAPLGHEPIAILDDLGEVVAGVDVHHGEGQPCGSEGEHGEVQQDGAVLATAEQQHRVLALGGDFADDGERLIGERVEVRGGDDLGAHTCNPHSVFALPLQRPARLSSPGATGRVHGQQPMLA